MISVTISRSVHLSAQTGLQSHRSSRSGSTSFASLIGDNRQHPQWSEGTIMIDAALEGVGWGAGSQPTPSTSGRRLTIPRDEIPLGLLLTRHDPAKVPASVISSRADVKRANRDAAWANRREGLLALAAAGVHVLLFAYNLAFWGSEGMPPDRYWPANPRIRLQIKPPRYGNLEGTKRIWYDYLAKLEGVK